jgi:hypothetical protein
MEVGYALIIFSNAELHQFNFEVSYALVIYKAELH